jgi:hypothetical protein
MGFEDEVEQSLGRRCRQTDGRSKQTRELTSSIVPRGTPFHHSVELEFPPGVIGSTSHGDHVVPIDLQRGNYLVEARAVSPNAVTENDAWFLLCGHGALPGLACGHLGAINATKIGAQCHRRN